MDLSQLSLSDLKRGWHTKTDQLVCNYCELTWPLTTTVMTITDHLQTAHGGNRYALIHLNSRYNTLTAKQQELLVAFTTGIKDKDLAQQLGVAPTTIRHQKFTFREKAKQAKLYLATYEAAFSQAASAEQLIDVPEQPAHPDDRWLITTKEEQQLLTHYVDTTQDSIRLRRWPNKQKAVITVLTRIASEIPAQHLFTETQINAQLMPIYDDYVMVRRYMIDYGFLERTPDGRQYWRPTTTGKE